MKRIFVILMLGLGFALVQTALFPKLFPFFFKPDLLLIFVVYIGLNETCLRGSFFSYSLGILQGIFTGGYPALYGLVMVAIFMMVRGATSRFNSESYILLLMIVFCATLLEGGLLVFLLGFFAEAGPIWSVILKRLFPQALLNLGAAYLMIEGVSCLRRNFGRRIDIPGLRNLDNSYES